MAGTTPSPLPANGVAAALAGSRDTSMAGTTPSLLPANGVAAALVVSRGTSVGALADVLQDKQHNNHQQDSITLYPSLSINPSLNLNLKHQLLNLQLLNHQILG